MLTSRMVILLLLLLTFCPSGALALVHQELSLQGVSGLLNTPNALVTPYGQVDLGYSNQIEEKWRGHVKRQENYYVSFGWLQYLELGARLTDAPGKARDLSASAKLQLPLLPEGWPLLAVGIQDVGGGAPNLRSRYLAASQTPFPWLRLSLGYGIGPDRLDGLFGGGEVQLADWLQVIGEHDGDEAAVGLRLSNPETFLPWPLRLSLTAKSSLDHGDFDLGLTLSLPLGSEHRGKCGPDDGCVNESSISTGPEKVVVVSASRVPVEKADLVEPVPAPPIELMAGQANVSTAVDDSALLRLQQVLVAEGFESVRVGSLDGHILLVEFENSMFNQNEVDALGLVLGTALGEVTVGFDSFALRLLNGELLVAEFRGPLAPFRKFFSQQECPAPADLWALRQQLQVVIAPTSTGREIWATPVGNSRLLHGSLVVAPGLANGVGTDFGVYDYRLSLRPDAYLQLWPGASLRTLVNIPLAWSDDYVEGGRFNRTGDNSTTVERILANQAFHLAPGIITMFNGGQFRKNLRGGINETIWSAPDGRHQLRLKAGMLADDSRRSVKRYNSFLGTYRFDWPEVDMQIEGTAGRFVGGDKGFIFEVRRFFGDTAIGFFFADTDYRIGGIRISLPLTPRRDMTLGPMQLRGTSQWDYQLQSVLVNSGGSNPLVFDSGVLPQTEFTLECDFLNRDRLSEIYMRGQLPRMLEAYWRYRAGHRTNRSDD